MFRGGKEIHQKQNDEIKKWERRLSEVMFS